METLRIYRTKLKKYNEQIKDSLNSIEQKEENFSQLYNCVREIKSLSEEMMSGSKSLQEQGMSMQKKIECMTKKNPSLLQMPTSPVRMTVRYDNLSKKYNRNEESSNTWSSTYVSQDQTTMDSITIPASKTGTQQISTSELSLDSVHKEDGLKPVQKDTEEREEAQINASAHTSNLELTTIVDTSNISMSNTQTNLNITEEQTFQKGDTIQANQEEFGTFQKGKISRCCKDGTYNIKQDDGDLEANVKSCNISRLMSNQYEFRCPKECTNTLWENIGNGISSCCSCQLLGGNIPSNCRSCTNIEFLYWKEPDSDKMCSKCHQFKEITSSNNQFSADDMPENFIQWCPVCLKSVEWKTISETDEAKCLACKLIGSNNMGPCSQCPKVDYYYSRKIGRNKFENICSKCICKQSL